MNLATVLTDTSARVPDRIALRLGDATTSYRELDDASARVAALLAAHSVGVGDRVGVMLPNVPEFASIYYGVLRRGAVVVPLNPLLKAREVAYHLTDGEAPTHLRLACCGPGSRTGCRASSGRGQWSSRSTRPRSSTRSPDTVRRRRLPTGPRTTPRSSSTPPAPPDGPRAPSSRTATCSATPRSCSRTWSTSGPTTSSSVGFPCSTRSVRPARFGASPWRPERAWRSSPASTLAPPSRC